MSWVDGSVDLNSRFDVGVTGLRWAANFSQSRRFLVLTLSRPQNNGLHRLLSVCNGIAREFKQPALYSSRPGPDGSTANASRIEGPPVAPQALEINEPVGSSHACSTFDNQQVPEDTTDGFHISIAWSHAAPEKPIQASETLPQVRSLKVPITAVKTKIGNVINVIELGNASLASSKPKWMGLAG